MLPLYLPQGQSAFIALLVSPMGVISISPSQRSHLTLCTLPSLEYSSKAEIIKSTFGLSDSVVMESTLERAHGKISVRTGEINVRTGFSGVKTNSDTDFPLSPNRGTI
jgi:hypothetical protein